MPQYLDVSAIVRWLGPPTGVTRVESELAWHALSHIELVVFDAVDDVYRPINAAFRKVLIGERAAIDPSEISPIPTRSGLRRYLPSLMSAFMLLEGQRRRYPTFELLIRRLQDELLTRRNSKLETKDKQGRPYDFYPSREVLGPPISLNASDTILVSGANWDRMDPDRFAGYLRRSGARASFLCYDLIPMKHPEFFPPGVAEVFGRYWSAVLPVAARVIVNAQCVANDVRDFSKELEIVPPTIEVCALGAAKPRSASSTTLPAELQAGRFALFVSTIEPRKNHALLLRIWKRLCARNWPQEHHAKLVFVGRIGWLVDSVLEDMADPSLDGTFVHLQGVNDDTLARLYTDVAFCLYPSRDEGFGLPVIEAFSYGKAVIASDGGALPEVVNSLSPTLDPEDDSAWESLIVSWFENPSLVRDVERQIDSKKDELLSRYDWRVAAQDLLSAGLLAKA